MRRVFVPLARMMEHKPTRPDCTLYRRGPGLFDDVEVREWPSPQAAKLAAKMSENGSELGKPYWKPWPTAAKGY